MRVTGELRSRVLAQIADPASQQIIALVLHEQKTAKEIADAVILPSTTLYRKISELRECGLLLIDSFVIRPDGKREARYACTFKEIAFKTRGRELELEITPSEKGLEKRWFEAFFASTSSGNSPDGP